MDPSNLPFHNSQVHMVYFQLWPECVRIFEAVLISSVHLPRIQSFFTTQEQSACCYLQSTSALQKVQYLFYFFTFRATLCSASWCFSIKRDFYNFFLYFPSDTVCYWYLLHQMQYHCDLLQRLPGIFYLYLKQLFIFNLKKAQNELSDLNSSFCSHSLISNIDGLHYSAFKIHQNI